MDYKYCSGLKALDRNTPEFHNLLLQAMFSDNRVPFAVVIELGSNDLCDPSVEPLTLALSISNLALEMLRWGVVHVYICQLMHRSRLPRGNPGYNQAVTSTNQHLEALLAENNFATFWKHKDIYNKNNWQRFLETESISTIWASNGNFNR